MAGKYKTEGRERLLEFLLDNTDKQLTADEITEGLDRDDAKASKSSVYRRLSELCEEGSVRKFRTQGQSSFVYQYVGMGDCRHHFHLKCISCGVLKHLDCHLSDQLLEHISDEHGFRIDSGRSVLYGFCADCAMD